MTLDRFFFAFVLIASQWIRQACSNVHEKKLARKVIGFSLQKAGCYGLTVSILGVLVAAKSGLIAIASVSKQRKMTASAKKISKSLINVLLRGLLIKRGDLLSKRSSTDRNHWIYAASDSARHTDEQQVS